MRGRQNRRFGTPNRLEETDQVKSSLREKQELRTEKRQLRNEKERKEERKGETK